MIYDFNSISNRLMQADFEDYHTVLVRFIYFIKNNDLIYGFIKGCGECEQYLENEFNEVVGSHGGAIFTLGTFDEEEVRNVFAILCYITENDIKIQGVALGYSSSTKYQDIVKGFNNRVVMVLIRHVERYLTKIGIDMGLDEKITYSITVENGQVNIANDRSTIHATNTVNTVDIEKLTELMEAVKHNAVGLSKEDEETLVGSLDVIKEETQAPNPRKNFLKTAIFGLQTIKGTVEFTAAVASLIQFIQPFL